MYVKKYTASNSRIISVGLSPKIYEILLCSQLKHFIVDVGST